jgi:hypothetical protein
MEEPLLHYGDVSVWPLRDKTLEAGSNTGPRRMEGSRSSEILRTGRGRRANLAWRAGAPRPGWRSAIRLESDKGPIRAFLDDKRAAAIVRIAFGFADI